jgi:hypothetical protein
MEHIRIQDQNVVGINLPGAVQVSIRDLKSDNTVTAITATNPDGIYSNVLTLVDSTLKWRNSSRRDYVATGDRSGVRTIHIRSQYHIQRLWQLKQRYTAGDFHQ